MQCCYPTYEVNPKASLLQQRYGHARRTCVEQHSYCNRESPCGCCQALETDYEYLPDVGKEALRHKYLGQEDVDGTVPRAVLGFLELKQTEFKNPEAQKSPHVHEAPASQSSRARKRAPSDTIPLHPFQGNRNAQHEALVQSWTTSSPWMIPLRNLRLPPRAIALRLTTIQYSVQPAIIF